MPYHHVAISLVIIITPKLSLFIGLLWLRIICMSPYFTIRLFYSICQLVHLLLEGKTRLGRYCEPFFMSRCLISFPLLQESLIIMLGSLPSIRSNFPPHSKLILGCFLSCHGYLDCCPLIGFRQPLSFIPPHCINHSIVGQYHRLPTSKAEGVLTLLLLFLCQLFQRVIHCSCHKDKLHICHVSLLLHCCF